MNTTRSGGLFDLGPQGALELFEGLVGAGEVGLPEDERFLVVVRVDETAGDIFD